MSSLRMCKQLVENVSISSMRSNRKNPAFLHLSLGVSIVIQSNNLVPLNSVLYALLPSRLSQLNV